MQSIPASMSRAMFTGLRIVEWLVIVRGRNNKRALDWPPH